MRRSIAGYFAAVLSAGWLLSVHPAIAQNPPAAAGQSPTAAANISDQSLDKAAAAIKDVQRIHQDYDQKISAAAPDQQEKLAEEGNAALKKAVTDQGLSVDEYNSIVQSAQNDPAVRERLAQRLGMPAK